MVGKTWQQEARTGGWLITCQLYLGWERTGSVIGQQYSPAAFPMTSRKPVSSKGSITYPNSTTNWRPIVQAHEPVGDITHSKPHSHWLCSLCCEVLHGACFQRLQSTANSSCSDCLTMRHPNPLMKQILKLRKAELATCCSHSFIEGDFNQE